MKIQKQSESTDVTKLLAQVLRLKGDEGGSIENYNYEPSLCAKCQTPVKALGQQAMQALATAEGIYFRCLVPCRCRCSVGFVGIVKDEDA